MDKWKCITCGYMYNPEHNVLPKTSFGELPEDWTCPICGASADQFKKVK